MTDLKNSYSHTYAITQRAAVDLSLSENPLGPSPKATEAIISAAGVLHLYPDEEKTLIRLIAQYHKTTWHGCSQLFTLSRIGSIYSD